MSSSAKRAGASAPARRVEFAQVGEQHGQLLLLAAQPEQGRVARHLLDQRRAEVVLEGRAQPTLLALADEVLVAEGDAVDHGQTGQRQQQVEPAAMAEEGPQIGAHDHADQHEKSEGRADRAAAARKAADHEPAQQHGRKPERQRKPRPDQEVLAQDVVDHRRMAREAGQIRDVGRAEVIADAGGTAADHDQLAGEVGGIDGAIEQAPDRDGLERPRAPVVDRDQQSLVGRQETAAERYALAEQQLDLVAADPEIVARRFERERRQVLIAERDHRPLEARRPVGVQGDVALAEPGGRRGEHRDRRQHAGRGLGRRRRPARRLPDDPDRRGRDRRRQRLAGVPGAGAERERQDDVAGALELAGELAVTVRALEQLLEPGVDLGRGRGRAAPLPAAQLGPQGLEGGGRHVPLLGLGQQQIERDGPGAGRGQAPHDLGDDPPAPRPAADLPEAPIVDRHQDDRRGGRPGRAQLEAEIEELALEAVDHGEAARGQVGKADGDGREQRRPEGRAPRAPHQLQDQGRLVLAMNASLRAAPQVLTACGGAPAGTVVPSPGRSTTSPARAGSALRTATRPASPTIAVASGWASAIHSVPRTEATAVLLSTSNTEWATSSWTSTRMMPRGTSSSAWRSACSGAYWNRLRSRSVAAPSVITDSSAS